LVETQSKTEVVLRGGIMNIAGIVSELKRERDRLNRAIAALEGTDGARTGSKRSLAPTLVIRKAKKGRHITAAGRKRLSEMMKKRWAERRRKGTVGRKAA
jgi:hypothetical protein